MNAVTATIEWLTDGDNWSGVEGIPHRIVEHLVISGESMGIAVLIAVPVALVLGHLRRGGLLAIGVSNAWRAVPSFALLVLCSQLFGFSSRWPILVAMVALALPPIMTNAYVGVTSVDGSAVEAARGMGLSGRQVLGRVEIPLAMPMIMGGIRTATMQVVATVTLVATIGQGTLGRFVIDGIAQSDPGKLTGGSLLVAALALLIELVLAAIQRLLTPGRRTVPPPGLEADQTTAPEPEVVGR